MRAMHADAIQETIFGVQFAHSGEWDAALQLDRPNALDTRLAQRFEWHRLSSVCATSGHLVHALACEALQVVAN